MLTILALAAASGLVTKQWTMTHGAKAFAATIGPDCLVGDGATIEAEGAIVTATDTPACAAEQQEVALNWVIFASTDAIVTVTGTPDALAAKRMQLEATFGKSPNPRLRFLAATQTCRCLVIAGKLSLEASKLVQGEPKPKDERRARLDPEHDPLDRTRNRDLIWRDEPLSPPITPNAPLTN